MPVTGIDCDRLFMQSKQQKPALGPAFALAHPAHVTARATALQARNTTREEPFMRSSCTSVQVQVQTDLDAAGEVKFHQKLCISAEPSSVMLFQQILTWPQQILATVY